MQPRLALLLLAVGTAQAQFSGLTTINDGSSVWFASQLRQRGTDQYPWSKIFRIDGNGVALEAQRDRGPLVPRTNPYVLDAPQVSGDGRWLLYRGTLDCGAGSSCFLSEHHSTTLRNTGTGAETVVGANARMSRNGRYLAVFTSTPLFRHFELKDQSSGASLFNGDFTVAGASIASDGTTAIVETDQLELVKNGILTKLRDKNVAAAVIDDSAATIVFETFDRRRLFVTDLKTLRTQQLGPDDRDSYQATLSADGQWVLYITRLGPIPQLFISRRDGTEWKQLTARGDGVLEATLSGDGNTAYAVTKDGSLLRIGTRSGVTETIAGPSPAITSVQATTPGSLTLVEGTNLGHAIVQIGGLAAPVFAQSSSSIWFQVPWEVPLTTNLLTVSQGDASSFEYPASVTLSAFAPMAIPLAPPDTAMNTPVAIHSDFNSLVTRSNPARPGEILHVYLTGGGAVSPAIATNAPAPASPLSRITTPINVVAENGAPLQVYYFGLAPGLVGVWQLDFAVPAGWQLPLTVQIRSDSLPGGAATLPAIPVATL